MSHIKRPIWSTKHKTIRVCSIKNSKFGSGNDFSLPIKYFHCVVPALKFSRSLWTTDIWPSTERWYSVRFNLVLYIFNFFNLGLHVPMERLPVCCQGTKMIVRLLVRTFLPIRFTLTSHSRICFSIAVLDSNVNFQSCSLGISSVTDWTFVFFICLRMLDHVRIQFRLTHRSLDGRNRAITVESEISAPASVGAYIGEIQWFRQFGKIWKNWEVLARRNKTDNSIFLIWLTIGLFPPCQDVPIFSLFFRNFSRP